MFRPAMTLRLGIKHQLSVVVCSLISGSDAACALGQASLSPMLEGEGSIPVQNIIFSPLVSDIGRGQAVWDCRFSPGTPVCSASLSYLQNKNLIPNSVTAELALHTTWLSLC